MAVKKVLLYPFEDKILRATSKPIVNFDRWLRILIKDMLDTIRVHPAVGLSAPQIGNNERVFLARFGQREDGKGKLSKPQVFVNPEIIEEGPLKVNYDGCLSIKGLQGYTYRPESIKVRAYDEKGKPFEGVWYGLDARVIHHEIDHLNGVLFIDYIEDFHNDLFVVSKNFDGDHEFYHYDDFARSLRKDLLKNDFLIKQFPLPEEIRQRNVTTNKLQV